MAKPQVVEIRVASEIGENVLYRRRRMYISPEMMADQAVMENYMNSTVKTLVKKLLDDIAGNWSRMEKL